MVRLSISLLLLFLSSSSAFVALKVRLNPSQTTAANKPQQSFSLALSSTDPESNNKKKSGLEGGVRNRLLAESIAPWRSLRLFLYFSLGSGAALGGFITATGLAAALSKGTEVNVNTEVLNLAIDFGAVAAFAFLAKFDLDKQKELNDKVSTKLEKTKSQKQVVKAMREREANLAKLSVEIQVSTDGDTTTAPLGDLQSGAKQHVILVVGPRKACKDALIGANLLKMDFAMSNVLVIPYQTDKSAADEMVKPTGSGFGESSRPSYENQPYVARAVGDGWDDYVKAEMKDAIAQNSAANPEKEGIAIVIANNGKVIRRGIGTVPWRQMVDQLAEEVAPGSKQEPVDYLFG